MRGEFNPGTAAIALPLWGVHVAHTGVKRDFSGAPG
jgi:hypothetical protein